MAFFVRTMLLSLCLLVAQAGLYAQTDAAEDVLYLHDGSVIRGEIVEQRVGEWVRIRIADGTVFTFRTSQIRVITREALQYKIRLTYDKAYLPIRYRRPGPYLILTTGMGFNERSTGTGATSTLHLRGGYYFHRRLQLGVGSGLDPYERGLVIPFYAEAMADLWQRKRTPHAFVQAGYGWGAVGDWQTQVFRGGIMLHSGLGVRIHTHSHHQVLFTLSYKMQQTYEEFEFWPPGRITPGGGWLQPDPVQVRGHRYYQHIFGQFSIAF
ncbi:MAG: hypothetical protein OHK0039_41200 [Bacteroidia bacterium]